MVWSSLGASPEELKLSDGYGNPAQFGAELCNQSYV